MANGYYPCGAANEEDTGCNSTGSNNAATDAWLGKGTYIERYFARFLLDIPAGATIDHAYLYVYNYNTTGAPGDPNVNLVDDNDCDNFSSNPYTRTLCSAGGGAAIAWSGFSGAATWNKSPDIAAQIQYFVNGSCTGGGYASGQYIGLALTADGAATNNYHDVTTSNYSSGVLGPFLVVAWTLAGGKCTKIAVVAGTDDDTYNISNDTTNDRTAETIGIVGQVAKSGNKYRSFLRFNPGVPKSATVDNAQLIICADGSNTDSVAFNAGIQALDDESTFTGNVYARAVIGGTATNWAIATGAWGLKAKTLSPDFAARITDRITQADYDPAGAGDYPYIGIRIGYGDAAANYESRQYYSYDAGTDVFKAILVIAYEAAVTVPGLEGTLDIPAPTVSVAGGGPVTVTVPALDGNLDVTVPAISAGAAVTAPVVEGTLDIPVPAVAAGANVTAPVPEGSLDVPIPTISAGAAVTAPALEGSLDVPVPTISAGVAVTVSAIEGNLDIPTPTISLGASVTVPALEGDLDVPAPVVEVTGTLTTVTVPATEGTLDVPVPTVSSQVLVTVLALDGTLDIPSPTVTAGVVVITPPVEGSLDIPVPSVSAGANMTVPALDGTLDIPVPGILLETVIVVPVIEGALDIPLPSLAAGVGISVPTIELIGDIPVPGIVVKLPYAGSVIQIAGMVRDKNMVSGVVRDKNRIEGKV